MKEFQQTLYKKDTKNKIRSWSVYTDEGTLTQISGVVGGAQTPKSSECSPKNVGRANETTAQEQAILEAQSKVRKKLDEGYFETQEEAENGDHKSPMLAKVLEKEVHKIDWTDCYVQPKSDGMRSFKEGQKLTSRKGKDIPTLPHLLTTFPGITDILDGELYAHGLDFETNMELIKKNRPESIQIKYHIYDIALPLPFSQRSRILTHLMKKFPSEYVELVPTYKVESMEDVDKYNEKFLAEGYEGTMVRWGLESYKFNGRSSHLLKYKNFKDIACVVTNVLPSDRNPEQGVVECRMDEKKWILYSSSGQQLDIRDEKFESTTGDVRFDYPIFSCGMKFSHAKREEILSNKNEYIGQRAEVRFFEYTRYGIPRFPVCVGFRLDK